MIDAGKCLYQKCIKIDPLIHYPELASKLALEGAMGMMDTLYNIDNITPIEQDESEVVLAPKISKSLSFVDFTTKTASEVFCLYRALNYNYPLRCLWGDKVVFLRSLMPIEKPKGKEDKKS